MSIRIKNKIDNLSAWEESNKPLLNGEIAFRRDQTGNVDMIVGDGSTSAKDLSDIYHNRFNNISDRLDTIKNSLSSLAEIDNIDSIDVKTAISSLWILAKELNA